MAARCRILPVVLTLLVLYLGNAAFLEDTDVFGVEYSVDGATGAEEDAEGVAVRLLERQRRDVDIPYTPVDKTPTITTTTTNINITTIEPTNPTGPNVKKLGPGKKKPTLKKNPDYLLKEKPATTTTTTSTTTTTTTAATGVDDGFSSAGGSVDVMNATTTTTSSTTSATTTTTTTPETKVEEEGKVEEEAEIVEPVDGFDTDNATVDHHRYYRSQSLRDVDEVQRYWVDLDSLVEEEVITNEMLSASHRRAATVRLTFEFPFYGHLLRNITIATGGFLFTGDFVHTWLAATQYIAPLMANFDTSMSKNASVKYADNGTSFTVQWNNVPLKDHADAGTFTFQVTLHKNGDIVFTYKQVPMFVTAIVDDQHPVKVGLSDAYIVDRTIFFVRRKTIYEYHKIDMKKRNMIGNWTAILFKALPTCVSMHTCTDCLSQKISSFQCQWCDAVDRCSNGLDRNRQAWLHNSCETRHVQLTDHCPPPGGDDGPPNPRQPLHPDTFGHDASVESFTAENQGGGGGANVGVVVGVVFLVSLLMGVVGWVAYAYFYPHSPSGQILIKYRPSTWSWRSGGARYTAAAIHSIHM